MSFTLEVHKLVKDKSGSVYTAATRPYLRLMCAESSYPLYIQGGNVYTEDGTEVKELPDWFYKEVAKCTKSVLKSAGMEFPEKEPVVEKSGGEVATVPLINTLPPTKKPSVSTSTAASGSIT